MVDAAFEELRDVLRQPDRRSLRHHLRRARSRTVEATAHASRAPFGISLPPETQPPAGRLGPPLEDEAGRRRQVSLLPPALAVVGVAVLVLGVAALRPSTPERARPPHAIAIAAPERAPVAPSPTTTAAVRLWPAEPVEVVGNEVRTGGHRWQVGEAGYLVAVGDWDCDHLPSAALVRPSTGEVAVFDQWPTEEDDVAEARLVGSQPGATSIRAGDRCGSLVVVGPDGAEVAFPTTRRDETGGGR
jgi:hypothetical protein